MNRIAYIIIEKERLFYEVTEETLSLLEREVFKAEAIISKWLSDAFGPVNGVIQFRPKPGSRMERARTAIDAKRRQSFY